MIFWLRVKSEPLIFLLSVRLWLLAIYTLTGFAKRTFIPYANTFGDSFVQGRVERIDTGRQAVVLEGGRVSWLRHLPGSDPCLWIYGMVCAAGDPVHPPHPVYWEWWDISREVQHGGVSPELRAVLRGFCRAGTRTEPSHVDNHIIPNNNVCVFRSRLQTQSWWLEAGQLEWKWLLKLRLNIQTRRWGVTMVTSDVRVCVTLVTPDLISRSRLDSAVL